MNKKMVKDDITTGYEAEMFASVFATAVVATWDIRSQNRWICS
jgi:hypothetical protein